jgi:putative oxidoreductase
MSKFSHWLFNPNVEGYSSIFFLRLFAGLTFLGEGILKFIFPSMGAIRFTLLEFPLPELTANAIGAFEIVGGICLLFGLWNNLFALLFAAEMVGAFLSTRITMFLGTSPLPLPPVPPQSGFWAVVHESRDEYSLFFTMIFLLIAGPGKLSLDYLLAKRKKTNS